MTKITNVTPEEREKAISTIEKVGEQVTDERIEYYVQLRRNTIKHQEEKASKEAVNQITEQNKEFVRKVLSYMGRSKSDRQIVLYSKKHLETLSYIKENNLDVDYTPSLFGEAIRFMEEQKSTTIHHLSAEDLANCLKDKKEELLNNRNKREEIQKEWRSNTKKEKNEDVVKKAKLLRNLALGVGVILFLAPFFITGFGFGWFWYLIIIGVAFFCLSLLGTDGKDKGDYSDAKIILIGFCIVGCIMFVWGPLNPKYERSGGGNGSYGKDKVTRTTWTCDVCKNTYEYYEDEIGEHNKWKYWSGDKICSNCYNFRKSVNDALKEKNSPYANYNH